MKPLDSYKPSASDAPGQPDAGPILMQAAASDAPRRYVTWALTASILAALISWWAGEALRGRYKDALYPNLPSAATAEQLARLDSRNVEHRAVTYGLFGALLGVALGAAAGLSRRSKGGAAVAAIVGLIAGGAAGAGTCLAVLPVFDRNNVGGQQDNLVLALLTHGAIWSAIGAAGGLAFGIGVGGLTRSLRAILGGLLGAVVATMLFEILGAMVFPLHRTSQPLSGTSSTRLLALVMVAVLAAVVAASSVKTTAPAREPVPPPG